MNQRAGWIAVAAISFVGSVAIGGALVTAVTTEPQKQACIALTGSPACDWAKMRSCVGDAARVDLPCAWRPGEGDNDFGIVIIYLDHKCPGLPAKVKCIDTTGDEYDE